MFLHLHAGLNIYVCRKMKKSIHILLLFAVASMLCACPYSSTHSIDKEPSIYTEDVLLGNWQTFIKKRRGTGEEIINMSLTKKTDTEYNISFTGYLDDLKPLRVVKQDSINGTAFMSTVDGRQFLNIHIYYKFYIAELLLKDNKLSLMPLAEMFTNKMIFDSETLKACVAVHYRTRVHPLYDDSFALRDMVKQD